MRLWEHEETGTTKPEHSNPYEYVAYVIADALKLTIDGHSFEAHAGDSFCVKNSIFNDNIQQLSDKKIRTSNFSSP